MAKTPPPPLCLGASDGHPTAADYGSKAVTLHRLKSAGLPVPPGFVLSMDACKSGRVAVDSIVETLGFPLAVRSSANIEDMPHSAAPGLFYSELHIADAQHLSRAIQNVLHAGSSNLVQHYCRSKGITETPRQAVIVQQQIIGPCSGVLYTQTPAVLQLAGYPPVSLPSDVSGWNSPIELPLTTAQILQLFELATKAEDALHVHTGLDVEWVWHPKSGPFLVQARPMVRPLRSEPITEPVREAIAFSIGSKTVWRWDATHNPQPLSMAQTGLVERMRGLAPYDMRVVGGYLYTAKGDGPATPVQAIDDPAILVATIHNQLWPKMERSLRSLEKRATFSVREALDVFQEIFTCYTNELTPSIERLHSLSSDLLQRPAANPLSLWIEATLRGEMSMPQLLDKVAPISPVWDIAYPTYGECPQLVHQALQRASLQPRAKQSEGESLSESDDLLFYRAQALVRRALLQVSARWALTDDAIFHWPLAAVLAAEAQAHQPENLQRQSSRAKAQLAERSQVVMPTAFVGGVPICDAVSEAIGEELWLGLGTGGQVQGTVLRVADMGAFPTIPNASTVLVMPSISPAHALAAQGAQAVICQFGEHLGHGAAMARELDIPCIVGCTNAWRDLQTGDTVLLDGDAGLVLRTHPKPQ